MIEKTGNGMIPPPAPPDEAARLAALKRLNLLDTQAEETFDRVTRLALRLFDVPIALVSLVDAERQWFKSKQGLAATETPREVSFCGHAILNDRVMVVPDAHRDERFAENPLVIDDPHIRFYAGCPLRAPDGYKVGTLCLIDRAPRELSGEDERLLEDLAQMVESNLAAMDLATTDELTGLSNRRGFTMLADKTLAGCRRMKRRVTVVAFDLDDFKEINDRHGHEAGDEALRDFAACLRETFRESDVIGRLGGDEFAVLLTGADAPSLSPWITRLDERLAGHCARVGRPYSLRFSAGSCACLPVDHTTLAHLLVKADRAMYQSKTRRRLTPSEPAPD